MSQQAQKKKSESATENSRTSSDKQSVAKVKRPPTAALAAKIERFHQAAYEAAGTALDNALQCGALLVEAKAKLKHGAWLPWLKANTTIAAKTAQKYMRPRGA